jgi:hypothetical protein
MTERPGREPGPGAFWTSDQALGEVQLWRDAWTLRLKAHISESSYSRSARGEIVPLTALEGTRTDVLARPYVLVPDITLSVQLYPQPDITGAVGEVRSSDWEGMKREEVGNCQGWFYHEDRIIVLWEAFFHERLQIGEPSEDPNLTVLWTGFERFLVKHFPTARQLVTTSTDPLYETDRYQRFLLQLGYTRVSQQAFGKSLPANPASPEQP